MVLVVGSEEWVVGMVVLKAAWLLGVGEYAGGRGLLLVVVVVGVVALGVMSDVWWR